eukprot:1140065-Pelagomonas_calceolata.AAC.7
MIGPMCNNGVVKFGPKALKSTSASAGRTWCKLDYRATAASGQVCREWPLEGSDGWELGRNIRLWSARLSTCPLG